ncbi:hypothetical protein [Ammoniphilus sp. CFH 90114]|uniref:hypothetical protein n=1 Tax=Ammoniphilus sp. CFH 90114 TaxID=2493665 RepID=UPI00100F4FBB|nr:hypothetical protein [Ammoniphilus sp. CFH 90114]RXT08027.1 hypothetical protein EIZ39_11485 [Ammoniphilus sp. CFH 90114]
MQTVTKNGTPYLVEIEATSHAWRKPFVALFEMLFRAGDAVRLGKTTLFVKNQKGQVVHEEYYGKSRKAAWHRRLEIEQVMKTMDEAQFLEWLKGRNKG